MSAAAELSRRTVLSAGMACVALAARAGSSVPADRHLAFEVWRNGHKIGRHSLVFSGDDQNFAVAIDVHMEVGLGPFILFRYHHQATETWRGGAFAALVSHTTTNGKHEQVAALRTSGGVVVRTASSEHTLSPSAHPLTHWCERALLTPLFNPQTGAPMRESVSREVGRTLRLTDGRVVGATRYDLRGTAQISDWYDGQSVWAALRAKASDGSTVDYRRVA